MCIRLLTLRKEWPMQIAVAKAQSFSEVEWSRGCSIRCNSKMFTILTARLIVGVSCVLQRYCFLPTMPNCVKPTSATPALMGCFLLFVCQYSLWEISAHSESVFLPAGSGRNIYSLHGILFTIFVYLLVFFGDKNVYFFVAKFCSVLNVYWSEFYGTRWIYILRTLHSHEGEVVVKNTLCEWVNN